MGENKVKESGVGKYNEVLGVLANWKSVRVKMTSLS